VNIFIQIIITMDQTIKDNWLECVQNFDAQVEDVYILLNPLSDIKRFYELVNNMFTIEGTSENGVSLKRRSVRILAAKYILECEKDAKSDTPQTTVITYPLNQPIPTSPATPLPWWQQPIYCTSDGRNIPYNQANNTVQ